MRSTRVAPNKFCQLRAQGRWFSATLTSSPIKTDRDDLTEILLKVTLNLKQTKIIHFQSCLVCLNYALLISHMGILHWTYDIMWQIGKCVLANLKSLLIY